MRKISHFSFLNSHLSPAFTLIEIILAVSISSILLWQGLVKYNDFNRRQQVKQAAQDFVSVLRQAQNSAVTGIKPCAADQTLDGYQVSRTDATSYSVTAVCNGTPLPASTSPYDLHKLTQFIAFTVDPFMFESLYGNTNSDVTVTVTIQHIIDNRLTHQVEITQGGEISCVDCD